MAARKRVNRKVQAEQPIFGIDTQEVTLLRRLYWIVLAYINEDASYEDLVEVFDEINKNKRLEN